MPYEGDPILPRPMIAQKVWQTADITITYPDGSSALFRKHRFLAIPGEPIRVMDAAGNVQAEFTPARENEVSNTLSTYHAPDGETGEHWHVANKAGGCGSCGGG